MIDAEAELQVVEEPLGDDGVFSRSLAGKWRKGKSLEETFVKSPASGSNDGRTVTESQEGLGRRHLQLGPTAAAHCRAELLWVKRLVFGGVVTREDGV